MGVDASCPGSFTITGNTFSISTNIAGNVSCPEGTFLNQTGNRIPGFTLTTNTLGNSTIGPVTCSTTIFAMCAVSNNGPIYTLLFSGLTGGINPPVTFPGVPPGQEFHITISGFQPNELFQGQIIIPEPATWLLLSSALLAFGGIRRRRNC